MATLTSIILRHTYQVVHNDLFSRQECFVQLLFATYFESNSSARDFGPAFSCRLVSGSRLPPRDLTREYVDYGNPRMPQKLVSDMRKCLEALYRRKPSLLSVMRSTLIDLHMHLPEEDRNDFLVPVPSTSSIEPLSRFWAGLLWYAICQDYVQSKKTKKGE